MPIFEYVCKDCQHRFETVVYGSNQPECPACRGCKLEQQFSVFSVGASRSGGSSAPQVGPCGACGDPRGPGSCSMN